ncbi:aromatic-L-amino-acid decarboxylase [Cryptococcus deuterogattii CA1014]|nr:aromatic-L-amino-acid decarboxylase [Cryptococcus deuterogattii MMRL2647]KIR75857.1 aromatic-L-amino-acid decarboxylase [Cryptococcus deuterogattii CA1014]
MDIEEFRKAGYAAVDAICNYYEQLPKKPVKAEVEPGYLLEKLPSEAPVKGQPFEQITTSFQNDILPGRSSSFVTSRPPKPNELSGITHWQSPNFLAYFPSNSTFESMLADLYAASVSNPGFNWICSPACTELEQVVVDWAAKMLGLSSTFWTESKVGGGVIMGSASEAALTAAMAARERALRILSKDDKAAANEDIEISEDVRKKYGQKLVIYGSTQTHSVGAKAAILLGLPFRAVPVTAEDQYALRGDALRAAIETDVAAGLIPFLAIGTVGTTSSGAVDRIAEIGQVLKDYPTMFLHIDAAWAGVAYALPEYRDLLRLAEVNEYANSFSTNFHKWGLTTFDATLMFVKNRHDLTQTFDVTPLYLRSKEADAGKVIDYRNWQIPLGRRFRSLKLWFVLRSYGIEGFQQHLTRGIEQCQQLASIVGASPDFELVTEPVLALLVFRLVPGNSTQLSEETLNRLNQRLYDRLDARKDVFLTKTSLKTSNGHNVLCIRFAMGGVHTKFEHVEKSWEVVEEEGHNTIEEWKKEEGN